MSVDEDVAGVDLPVMISVNQPGSVTFTSVPAGFISYTANVPTVNATLSLPTNPSTPVGVYSVVATPTGGGASAQVSINVTH